MNQHLGQTVTQVQTLTENIDRELSIDGSGDCGTLIWKYFTDLAHQITLDAGYSSYQEFLDEVDRRTSYRWTYMSGLAIFAEED